MTKSLTIALCSILLVSLGIFSVIQVKKLKNTKTNLTEQIKTVERLEENLDTEVEEKSLLSEINIQLEDENLMLRDSIAKLHRVIARLRKKVNQQDAVIAELRRKLTYLQEKYDTHKQEIAVLSRRDNVDNDAIVALEAKKAEIKNQINEFESEQHIAESVKMSTEKEINDKIASEERFRKIVDVVNNTRIKFQDIKIKMDATGTPVTRLISDGKNWKHTDIEFFMNHENKKVLLDEQFMVKIVDMDFQEEIAFVENNPLSAKNDSAAKPGAPFYFDGNLVEINHNNNAPKKGKNYEVQVYYQSDDGEEYLLLDGVKQFIRDGSVVLD